MDRRLVTATQRRENSINFSSTTLRVSRPRIIALCRQIQLVHLKNNHHECFHSSLVVARSQKVHNARAQAQTNIKAFLYLIFKRSIRRLRFDNAINVFPNANYYIAHFKRYRIFKYEIWSLIRVLGPFYRLSKIPRSI